MRIFSSKNRIRFTRIIQTLAIRYKYNLAIQL